MLVNKTKYDKDDIVTFKIANGDEIVAKIVSEDENEYVLSKPTVVIPTQTGGLKLIPALFSVNPDKNISLSKKHIMIDSVTVEEVSAYYTSATTGIQVPAKSKIIT